MEEFIKTIRSNISKLHIIIALELISPLVLCISINEWGHNIPNGTGYMGEGLLLLFFGAFFAFMSAIIILLNCIGKYQKYFICKLIIRILFLVALLFFFLIRNNHAPSYICVTPLLYISLFILEILYYRDIRKSKKEIKKFNAFENNYQLVNNI